MTSLPVGTVTFLFSDIEGSSNLLRALGDERFASIRATHHRLLRVAFGEHGGHEIDTAGDGFFVAFASTRDAVAAAATAQRGLAEFDWPDAEVRVRMGLHTAEPYLSEQGYVGIGVHRAARICAAARGGQILVSNATAGIVEDADPVGIELADLGEHRLKDLPRPQRLFQLTVVGLRSEFGAPRTPELALHRSGTTTFLFTDLTRWRYVISTIGDEASDALASAYHASVGSTVEANDGIAIEVAGDHVLAAFPEAGDAIRAAAALRDSVRDFSWPEGSDVRLRAAVHPGRWSGDPRRPAAGTAFVRLGRFAKMAEPGQVLVSQAAVALAEGDADVPALRSLGAREFPDQDEPERVYELVEP